MRKKKEMAREAKAKDVDVERDVGYAGTDVSDSGYDDGMDEEMADEDQPSQTALERHLFRLLEEYGIASMFAPKHCELQFEAPCNMVISPGQTMTIAFDSRHRLEKGERFSVSISSMVVSSA